MDAGQCLVTKIVDEGKLNHVLRSGITEDFLDEDSSQVLSYIKRHYTEYKGVPTRDAVQRAFPGMEFADAKEPVEYYIDLIKEVYRRSLLEENLSEIAGIYNRDTKRAEALLRDTLASLSITQRSFQDIDVTDTVADRLSAYKARKDAPGADGILSGWRSMDNETLGWHGEEFIVLVGEKYTGKSWLMIWLAYQAMLQGERVLFVTKEMSQRQIVQRFDSVYAHVPFDSLRKGILTNQEEERYKKALLELEKSNLHFLIARQGVYTVDDIASKAIETDATIIFGDSIYLFPPDNRSEKLAETPKRLEISHKCKDIAANLGIPFVVSVQAGRRKTKKMEKPDLDRIEWANSFSQDAETVFFIQRDELDLDIHRAQMYLLKSRDGKPAEFYINQDFQWMQFDESKDKMSPTTEVFKDDEESIWSS